MQRTVLASLLLLLSLSACTAGRRSARKDAGATETQDVAGTDGSCVEDGAGPGDGGEPEDALVGPCVSGDANCGPAADTSAGPSDVADSPPADDVGPRCTPSCGDRECGDDGCGGSCGKCPAAAPLCNAGFCAAACKPSCDGRECGDDGCGGSCGTCGKEELCSGGVCQSTCEPACGECGDDGCGGSCGTCGAFENCVEGECIGLGCGANVSPCECLIQQCVPSSTTVANVACNAIEAEPGCLQALVDQYFGDDTCGFICSLSSPIPVEVPFADVLCGNPACAGPLAQFQSIMPTLCSSCGL